ncbi:MAG: SUMF1/EgtB/PvdO family nonheme iron enzyme [Candidatus Binatia bacterium]
MAVGSLVLLIAPAHGVTGVLCISIKGKGTVKVRDTGCKPSEVQVGTFDTGAPQASFTATAQCPADSVRVGSVCVDKYEASVWETTDAATIAAIRNGEIDTVAELSLATQRGELSDDYDPGCPDTGNGCLDYYAVSVPGVTPSNRATWFQAAAACRNAHKRLATNQEWQMAALGTPDPGTDDETTDCNVGGPPFGYSSTGSRSACVSDTGAFDMVGNVAEWVADWGDGATNCTNWSPTYGTDLSCVGGDGSTNLPGALTRGGAFSSGSDAGVFAVQSDGDPSLSPSRVGFRCVREPQR